MTAQLSRERLEEIIGVINAGAYGYSVSAEEIGAMARMLLAATDSEPVAVPDEISTTDAMRAMNGRVITMSVHTAYKNGWNACRAAMQAEPVTAATVPEKCWCRTCRPVDITYMRFVVCPDCGNKRCPRANDHRNACSGSNEPGQVGSAYPAAPEQEV